jgi:TnpA family transposase
VNKIRTAFLLDFISDIDLRRTIQAATNKSEAFNLFVQWVAFGGGRLLAENTRDEQRKMIKYHHLAANLLIFHNVVTMTKALKLLVADGHEIDEAHWHASVLTKRSVSTGSDDTH